MRRARFKVAPNLGLASRPSKSAETPTNVVVESSNESSVLTVEPNTPQETCNSANATENAVVLDVGIGSGKSLHTITPLPSTPELAAVNTPQLPQSSESTLSCVDKENLIAVVPDEACSENQVSASVEDQNQSGVPFSRYKARNKVRPVIRDAPHRIRTFSSASESEDDVGRRQSRTPLSPVKKSPTKKDNVETAPLATPSPKTEKGKKGKKKVSEKTPLELKKAAMRKKFANGQVDRKQLTMFDLIYYNPADGDRPPNSKEKLQMRLKPYEVEALASQEKINNKNGTSNNSNTILDELLDEEEEMKRIEENPEGEKNKEESQPAEEDDDGEGESMPVPQVRLGPDGEIILDDQSLVIDTSETKRNKNQLANAPVIIENSATLVNYGSWRKRQRSARWSLKETARFYRALSMLGTDFSLMEKLFPNRPRIELKRKFKSEEKNNPLLVDKIISSQIPFDATQFHDDYDIDSSDAESTNKEKPKKGSKVSNKSPRAKGAKGKSQKKTNNTAEEVGDSPSREAEEPLIKKNTKKRKTNGDEISNIVEDGELEDEHVHSSANKDTKKRKKAANGSLNITTGEGSVDGVSVKKTSKRRKKDSVGLVTVTEGRVPEDSPSDIAANSNGTTANRGVGVSVDEAVETTTKDTSETPIVTPDVVLEKETASSTKKSLKPRSTKISARPPVSRKALVPRIDKSSKEKAIQQCNSGETPTSSQTKAIEDTSDAALSVLRSDSDLTIPNVTTPLDSLLKSPLGQMSLEQGGLTVVENSGAPKQAPSFLVPPALAEANPAFAQAEPGSLVLVTEPNPGDPENQLVHVYRISVPIEPVPT